MADLIACAVLALAAFVGWRRGTLLMLLGLAALGAGYVAAIMAYRPVGNAIHRSFPSIPLFIALPIGGALVMFVVTTLLRLATAAVARRRAAARLKGAPPSPIDNAGGAAIGMLHAGGYVIVAAWVVMSAHSLLHKGPDISGSLTGKASARVMQRATYALSRRLTRDPLVSSVMSAMVIRPKESAEAVNALMRNPNVQGLWTNQALRSALVRGDTAALAGNASIRLLAGDADFRAAAAQLGLAPEQASPQALARALTAQATPLARTVENLRSDPDVQRLLDDPEIKRKIEAGNFASLMSDPRFNQLAERVMASLRQGGTAP